jgi:hypothetical protein
MTVDRDVNLRIGSGERSSPAKGPAPSVIHCGDDK